MCPPLPYENKKFYQTSRLLLRNLDRIPGSKCLIVNYPPDYFLLNLHLYDPDLDVTAFSYDYAAYEYNHAAYTAAGLNPAQLTFNSVYSPIDTHYDVVIVFLPKSRSRLKMTLAMLASNLPIGTRVLVVGENRAGIRSARTLLADIGPTVQLDAARHCVLYQTILDTVPASFDLAEWVRSYETLVVNQPLTIISLPGVFSHGRFDAGTAFLLETLDRPLEGRVLDFGCGSGVIGTAVTQLWSTGVAVEFLDKDALALEATRRTLQSNVLPAESVQPSNVFSNVQGTFDAIISNPPFHKENKVDYQTTIAFLKEAGERLRKGGVLRIVVNRFLKYGHVIEANVGRCQVIAENRSFRIYEAIRE